MSIFHPDARARYQQFDRLMSEVPADPDRRSSNRAVDAPGSQNRNDPKDRPHVADSAHR